MCLGVVWGCLGGCFGEFVADCICEGVSGYGVCVFVHVCGVVTREMRKLHVYTHSTCMQVHNNYGTLFGNSYTLTPLGIM